MNYKKQALYNTLGNLIYLFAQWLLTVITTRISGVEAAGVLTLAISIGNIFYFIQMYGMRSYQAADVDNEFSSSQYLKSRYITTVIGLLLIMLLLCILHYPIRKTTAILAYTLFRSFEALSDVLFGEMQKIGRLDISAKSMCIKSIAMLVIFTVAQFLWNNVAKSLFCITLVALLIYLFYDYRNYCKLFPKPEYSHTHAVPLLKNCFLLLLTTLFPIVITSLPRTLLESYYGTEILGYYGNVSTPTVLITAIVPNLLTPFMTLYGKLVLQNDYKILMKYFFLSIAGTVALGGIFVLGVIFAGQPIMSLIYTSSIIPYVHYLYPLIIATVIYALGMCGNSILISMKKNKEVTIFSGISLIVCILIANPLIQHFGINGTILTMGISYMSQNILQIIFIIKYVIKGRKI